MIRVLRRLNTYDHRQSSRLMQANSMPLDEARGKAARIGADEKSAIWCFALGGHFSSSQGF